MVAQHPGERQLRQDLATALGDTGRARSRSRPVSVTSSSSKGRTVGGAIDVRRGPLQVAVGEQALRERSERDRAHAVVASASVRPPSIQRLSSEYDGWWITSGVPSRWAIAAASAVCSAEYDEMPT